MAIDNEIIIGIIADFNASKSRVVEEIKKGLTKTRSGLEFEHNLTGGTANSIEVKQPSWDGLNLTWEFDSDTGSGLNKGIEAGKKVNIQKIVDWVGNRHGLYGNEAKRMAYFIVKKMDARGNPKKKGWFDEVEPNVENVVNSIITESMTRNIQLMVDKNLNKKIK